MLCQTIIDRTLEQIKSSRMNLIWFRLGRRGKIKFNLRFDLLPQNLALCPREPARMLLFVPRSPLTVHEINATLPLISKKKKKKTGSCFYCLKNEPKKLSGGNLTSTQKAAGPSEESIRNHPVWIVKKRKFKDFRATWRYVFNILVIHGLYSSYL